VPGSCQGFATLSEPFVKLDTGRSLQESLMERQRHFDRSPTDVHAAYKYFRELNRNQKYQTVLRLYNKYETDYRSSMDARTLEKLENQRSYAQKYMESIEMVSKRLRDSEGGPNTESLANYAMNKLPSFCVRLIFMAGLFFTFNYLLKEASQKLGDKYKFEIKTAKDISQRLDDVKGIDEIKEEIQNLIKMIKEPKKYSDKGAVLHKGVLLFGEPGVGKTLIARAIAGEAGTNFIYCTGSNFDEMWVGLGAKRVRELFTEAKKHTPCIIFIDEIDSLLSKNRR